jgi:hypothetical protein
MTADTRMIARIVNPRAAHMRGIHTRFSGEFAQEVDGGGTEGMLRNHTCKRFLSNRFV